MSDRKGRRISRKEAREIALKIMENAEAERIRFAEEEAKRYMPDEEPDKTSQRFICLFGSVSVICLSVIWFVGGLCLPFWIVLAYAVWLIGAIVCVKALDERK